MAVLSFLLCISCNRRIQEGIFNEAFAGTFIKVVLPILVLVPLLLFYARSLRHTSAGATGQKKTPVVVFSLLLGMGLGGFLDGIVLHQLLQWHQMISNQLAPTSLETKSINMFWDGVFEAVTWLLTLAGILLLWHSRKRTDLYLSNRLFIGGLTAGWGLFNLLDSVMNHFLFRLHNVRENAPDPAAWNVGFLLLSLVLIAMGWALIKSIRPGNPS